MYYESQICLYFIPVVLIIIGMVLGIVLIWRPKRIIEIQIAFYRFFNWKVEPISMAKEIKITRIMGTTVLIIGIIALIYIIIQQI